MPTLDIPVFYWHENFGFQRGYNLGWKKHLDQLEEQLKYARKACTNLTPYNGVPLGGIHPTAVLVAPEYLFRLYEHDSEYRLKAVSYPEHEKNQIIQGLAELSAKYPEILIFGGTIVWHKEMNKLSPSMLSPEASSSNVNSPAMVASSIVKDTKALEQEEIARRQNKYSKRVFDWQHPRTPINKSRTFLDPLTEELDSIAGYSDRQTVYAKQKAIKSDLLRHIAKNTCYVFFDGKLILKYSKQHDFHEIYQDDTVQFVPGVKCPTITVWGKTLAMMICSDYNAKGIKVYADTRANIWVTISDILTVSDIPPTGTKKGFAAHIAAAGNKNYCQLTLRSNQGLAKVTLTDVTIWLQKGILSIPLYPN
ncbi:hypothetical protein G3N59_07555 [Paraburkholderia sp. Ac-20340]|uniref:hypothetical protein n=1 Tax=Paraburkholderia sp. Ac-20340 TaxID=2703888 RepID=UPI0019819DD6|nr:hypothetical protein [Paraburkholderia sp. Ac-20340]MBN3853227.1 hypothetical protein [Paraburkholderia sp. Ac-20340]